MEVRIINLVKLLSKEDRIIGQGGSIFQFYQTSRLKICEQRNLKNLSELALLLSRQFRVHIRCGYIFRYVSFLKGLHRSTNPCRALGA